MKKLTKVIAFLIVVLTLSACIFGCTQEVPPGYNEVKYPINYSIENNYEVRVYEYEGVFVYEPVAAKYEYGIIFYLGTAISAENYNYIGTALASQGYLVCMPNNLFAYVNYSKSEELTETIFELCPDVQFFLGGHSQGGGAATKMSNTYKDDILGTILYSPLSYEKDSIADSGLPVLFFEAENDKVLTDSMKAESKTTLPVDAECIFLEGCNHMGYSDMKFIDGDCEIGVENQQKLVADYTLNFMARNLK